jgi:hypothetical protein
LEYEQEAYSEEDVIIRRDVHLGVEGTNSNGHGEGKDEDINLVDTIIKL